MNPIFRLQIRGLSAQPEEKMLQLHQDLVASVAALDFGIKVEEQLFIWFHHDLMSYGLDREIEVEVDALKSGVVRDSTAALQILTALGNVMLKAYPGAYVFCHMPAYADGDLPIISWSTLLRTNKEQVKEAYKLVRYLLTEVEIQTGILCYRASQAKVEDLITTAKNKLAAEKMVAVYKELLELGKRAVEGRDSPYAQALADAFIATCRARTSCVALHKEMRWQ